MAADRRCAGHDPAVNPHQVREMRDPAFVSNKPTLGMGQVYRDASAEAKRRGDRRVSTEHIALAMLVDPDSETARAVGVSLESARAALDTQDREALTSVGIEVINNPPVISGRLGERLRLTPAGRGVFAGLRREAGGERLGVKHVLLALLSRERPDPAAELFHAIGVDRTEARNRLQQT
jgi:ATP-dependent Clp protease ATP-binding subunit ClpA